MWKVTLSILVFSASSLAKPQVFQNYGYGGKAFIYDMMTWRYDDLITLWPDGEMVKCQDDILLFSDYGQELGAEMSARGSFLLSRFLHQQLSPFF